MSKKIVLAFLILAIGFKAKANFEITVIGLWEVTSVKVGDKSMTPIAKWSRFNADGTYQSGNGWTQNDAGTFNYDEKKQVLVINSTYGIKDPAGAFQVRYDFNGMIWERIEEGMKVTVELKRIGTLPMSPADLLIGLWEKQGEEKEFLYIGPDKRFRLNTAEGRKRGVWFVHPHRNELTLIPADDQSPYQSFDLKVEAEKLILKSGDSTATKSEYIRLRQFPD